ncbi:MAG: formylglycine-generating enzyme family protein [Betaproteobacteria bacterium]|nr:formylglycine-generating enzyme family protein [Betaproteobacteria bacterium]
MKRYLLLVPDAPDARAAQDKIYQWEGVAGPELAEEVRNCPECPEMVIIPAGSFDMGSSPDEYNYDDQGPVHRVTISRAFAMGKTEVTQGQWRAVMGNNPSDYFKDCGNDCPVDNVSWNDAQEFIQKLNAKTGKQYRLPSEAEWEYACRAGGQHIYCGSDNLDSVGWYYNARPVATKQANAFGLYDMSGNVWEWVEDSWHNSYNGAPIDGSVWQGDGAKRVLRGGSKKSRPLYGRAAIRDWYKPARHDGLFGFRLARMLP